MLPGKKTYRKRRYKGAIVCHADGTITIISVNGQQTKTVPQRLNYLNPLLKKAMRQFDNQKQCGLY